MPESKLVDRKVGAICLTAEVEIDGGSASGFRIADAQRTVGTKLYGFERFAGIAAAMRLDFAYNYFIIGGDEDRYPGQGVDRAQAFKAILEKDLGAAEPKRIHTMSTGANTVTEDSIAMVRDLVRNYFDDFVVVTSWYHCLRTANLYRRHGLPLDVIPAEAFLLIEGSVSKDELITRFGGGDFAKRCVGELNYYVDQLTGKHKPIRK